jgi:eukaryotic-like serine/threonine-protein kinase
MSTPPPKTGSWRCPACAFGPIQVPPGSFCPQDGRVLVPEGLDRRKLRDPVLGTVIGGRYAVFDILGKGGMGSVYAGVQVPMARPVAVKVVLKERIWQAEKDDLRARFMHEARLLSRFSHRNIVTLYDYGEDQHLLYMVQERIEGQPLNRVALPLTLERALGVAEQVLTALAEPHAEGLVHRDIKPGNVMLGSDGKVTLIDFGIAKLVEHDDEDTPRTRTGLALGTPRYMAPEQLLQRGEVGPWTDQYAMGVLLYTMLSGHGPFTGSEAEVVAGHLKEEPPPLPDHLAPPQVLAAISRALSKSPEARFPHVLAFREALSAASRDVLPGESLDDGPTLMTPPPIGLLGADTTTVTGAVEAPPIPARSRTRWVVLGTLLVGAGAVLGALAWPDAERSRAAVAVPSPERDFALVHVAPLDAQMAAAPAPDARVPDAEVPDPPDAARPTPAAAPAVRPKAPPMRRDAKPAPRVRPKPTAAVDPRPRIKRLLAACECDQAQRAINRATALPAPALKGLRQEHQMRCQIVGMGCNTP